MAGRVRETMFQWPLAVLTVATALATGLPWLLMMTAGLCSEKRVTTAAIAFCQFGVFGLNAISRQIVQNVNLKPFLDVSAQATDVQWGPLCDVPDRLRDRPIGGRLDARAGYQVQGEIAGSQRLPECVWVYGRSPGAVGSRLLFRDVDN